MKSLLLLFRQSCARTDIASPSSLMVEETPGGGWDRGVGGHGGGQVGEIGEVQEKGFG